MAILRDVDMKERVKQQLQRGRRRWALSWLVFFLIVGLVLFFAVLNWQRATRRQVALLVQPHVQAAMHFSFVRGDR